MDVDLDSTGMDSERDDDGAAGEGEPSCGHGFVEDGDELSADSCDALDLEPDPPSCRSECTFDVTRCDGLPAAPVMSLGLESSNRSGVGGDQLDES
ncbi:MAG: hypothetical protein K0V04_26270, partial [Deltaproteobacteria bacterium]|nr:hypothetical protein [Deltaproteobacteria bacterium]